MARIKDLWLTAKKDSETGERRRTLRYGRGRRWLLEYRDPTGATRTETFERRPDAEARLTDVKADVQRGEYIDPRRGRVLFRDLSTTWLEGELVEPTTLMTLRYKVNGLNEVFGDYPVGDILTSKCRQWRAARARQVAPGTVNGELWLLTAILDLAVEDDMIRKNPAKGLDRLPNPRLAFDLWPLATVRAILDNLAEQCHVVWPVAALAFGVGERQGEAFAAAVEDIDFLRRKVYVNRQLLVTGNGLAFGPPKRGSYGWIPVEQELLDRLAAHIAKYPPREVTLPWVGKGAKPGEERTVQLLSTGPRGRPLRRETFNGHWVKALVAAGVTPAGKKTGIHILRHAFASYLLAEGKPITVVQARLRHKRLAETYETYAHVTFEEQLEGAIASVFRSAPVPSGSVPVPARR